MLNLRYIKPYHLKHSRISIFHIILDHNKKYDHFHSHFEVHHSFDVSIKKDINTGILLDMNISFLKKNQAHLSLLGWTIPFKSQIKAVKLGITNPYWLGISSISQFYRIKNISADHTMQILSQKRASLDKHSPLK